MPLKVVLKPQERLIIGGAVVTNGGGKAELVVENNVPILRGKDVLRPADADTPCKRIYLAIQLMYVDPEGAALHQKTYATLISDVAQAAPSTRALLDEIDAQIRSGGHFAALKLAKRLIAYEAEAMRRARTSSKKP
jgi:flagellar protein FlbT